MIPILKSGENVVGFLVDATSCAVTEERNGIYELELTYPVAGPLFGELMVDRFIQAKPNDTANLQLFRIYEITKPINGIVTVNGEHISYALAHYPVTDVRISGTATQAVNAILAKINAYMSSHRFTVAETGFAGVRNFKYQVGSARAALGGTEGSVLDTYGGEFEFDNYTVKIHEHRGRDTGVVVAYRKNMTDLKVTTSLDSAYTRLFPYAIKDDALITIPAGTISVTNNSGIAERVMIRDFSSDFEEEETVDASRLQTKAEAYLRNKNINAPAVNISVSFVHLWQSPEYADVAVLEQVSLCDYVTIRHEILGVDIKAQVIKTVYDSLSERYESVELGEARANFQDTVKNTVQDVSRLVQKLSTELDTSAITQAYTQAIADATALITGSNGGYVHLVPSQNPQEIIISDIENYKSASAKVWRWNKNGLGFSSTGYNGTFSTAITSDGKIIADSFRAGAISASVITGGVLTSEDGTAQFNLEDNYLLTEQRVAGRLLTAKMTTGAYRLMLDSHEIGALGMQSGDTKGVPWLYYNDEYADSLEIGHGSHEYACPNIIVQASKLTFITDGTIRGYIDADGYHGAVYSFNTWRDGTYAGDYTKIWNAINGKASTNHNHDSAYLSRSWYSQNTAGGYAYDYNQIWKGINGKASSSHEHSYLDGGSAAAIYVSDKDVASFYFSGSEPYCYSFGCFWAKTNLVANGKVWATGYEINSTEDIKANIAGVSSVLDLFLPENSQIYTYNLKKDTLSAPLPDGVIIMPIEPMPDVGAPGPGGDSQSPDTPPESTPSEEVQEYTSTGFVIGRETPEQIISEDGKRIDLYSMASINWKATQELLSKVKNLEDIVYGNDN